MSAIERLVYISVTVGDSLRKLVSLPLPGGEPVPAPGGCGVPGGNFRNLLAPLVYKAVPGGLSGRSALRKAVKAVNKIILSEGLPFDVLPVPEVNLLLYGGVLPLKSVYGISYNGILKLCLCLELVSFWKLRGIVPLRRSAELKVCHARSLLGNVVLRRFRSGWREVFFLRRILCRLDNRLFCRLLLSCLDRRNVILSVLFGGIGGNNAVFRHGDNGTRIHKIILLRPRHLRGVRLAELLFFSRLRLFAPALLLVVDGVHLLKVRFKCHLPPSLINVLNFREVDRR